MGFHLCEYCPAVEDRYGRGRPPCVESAPSRKYDNTSSGDVTLFFLNGNSYTFPDMILHYLADHNWLPPAQFIRDVMHVQLAKTAPEKSRPSPIGYLSGGDLVQSMGPKPPSFIERLEALIATATTNGWRLQTRGC